MYVNVKELKVLLIRKDKSMQDLANCLGISKSTLYRKLNGDSDFYRHEMIEIAKFLETDNLDSIFFSEKVT